MPRSSMRTRRSSSIRTRPRPSASNGSWPPPRPSTRSKASSCAPHPLHRQAAARRHLRGQARRACAPAPRRSRISWARCCRSMTPPGAGRFGFTAHALWRRRRGDAVQRPANLLIQKVAPALAVGNAVVVKPSPPGTEVALLIAEAVKTAGVPDGLFNVVPGGRDTEAARRPSARRRRHRHRQHRRRQRACPRRRREEVRRRTRLQRGQYRLRRRRPRRRGDRIAGAAFEASGQQCISAQRVIVERPSSTASSSCSWPPPRSSRSATRGCRNRCRTDGERRRSRPRRANGRGRGRQGRQARAQAARRGAILGPAIVADAPPRRGSCARRHSVRWWSAWRSPTSTPRSRSPTPPSSACRAPASPRRSKPRSRCRASRVGSLWINDASRFRLDTYPFGGVGASGYGREGVRYAMEELSQWKFTGLRLNPQ